MPYNNGININPFRAGVGKGSLRGGATAPEEQDKGMGCYLCLSPGRG